jgi:glycosyltransferase involved in cell wall biosynthesis
MRILVLNYEFPPLGGGAGNVTAQITRHLVRNGAEVVVLTSHFKGLPRVEQRDGYTIHRVPAMRRRLDRCSVPEMGAYVLGAIGPALKLASSFRPDLMHVYFGMPTGVVALLVHQLKGIPYLLSLQGGDVPGFLGKELALLHGATLPMSKLVWSRAGALIVNSKGLHERAVKTLPGRTFEIVPNGVDLEAYRPAQVRADDDKVRLIFVGRFANQKGLPYLLRSLATFAPSELRKLEVELVGGGPEEERLKALTSELNLSEVVRFPGWVSREEIIARYQRADLFVLPSLDEGMPLVLLEAMACGKPVVGTEISGTRELVQHGANGLLVPPADVDALAQALRTVVADPNLRERMGRKSRALVSNYDWSCIADRYLELSEQMLHGRTVRAFGKV